MNINIKTHLAAALCLTALLATGCTQDDLAGQPAGSVPLAIGSVTIAGDETSGGNTRTATTEDATGYTGIRKTSFVEGDKLTVTATTGPKTETDTYTLTNGVWVGKTGLYGTPGTTVLTAKYAMTSYTWPRVAFDDLTASVNFSGQEVAFSMKHDNAMIDITVVSDGIIPKLVCAYVSATGVSREQYYEGVLEEDADGSKHYHIVSKPGTLNRITAEIGGKGYVYNFTTPMAMDANKRYPIILTVKGDKLTATVGIAGMDWAMDDTGKMYPAGYTVFLRTPEDLAQFAKDVNDDTAGTGASKAVVLQMADIDLSKLKLAADAGKTYTATADSWVAINNFKGAFNGNGYTISNLKSKDAGLFGTIEGAKLIGIHLRGVVLSAADESAPLAANVKTSIVTLCSATGSMTFNGTKYCGGFVAYSVNSTFTRCSADVDFTVTTTLDGVADAGAGGFIGCVAQCPIVACTASGDLKFGSAKGALGGFVGYGSEVNLLGCSFTGTTIGGSRNYAFSAATKGSLSACYATPSGATGAFGAGDLSTTSIIYKDCAYVGQAQPVPITGITGSVTVKNLYSTLTTNDASLADVKTLHWSAADGYTLTEKTGTWYATKIWKNNSTLAPTINMAYEGGN